MRTRLVFRGVEGAEDRGGLNSRLDADLPRVQTNSEMSINAGADFILVDNSKCHRKVS